MQVGSWVEVVTRPHPTIISHEEQRRSRLVAALTMGVFATVLVVAVCFSILRPEVAGDPEIVTLYIGAIMQIIAFVLNRNGHYGTAARFILVSATITVIAASFFPEAYGIILNTTVIPVLLAGFLFAPRVSAFVAALTVTTSLISMMLVPQNSARYASYVDTLLLVIVIDIVIIAFMYYQQAVERDRVGRLEVANQLLRESEVRLEQRVVERTKELVIALERAEQADHLKSEFLASISHELRTPMNAILNFNQFVSSGLYGAVSDRQVDALDKSTNSARHLLMLINDVLDISKIEAGRMDLEIEEVCDLYPEIEEVIAMTRTMLVGKSVELKVEIADDMPPLNVDRRRIKQCLLNLTSNAAKFTEDGHITLRAWHQNGCFLFSVEDTGSGIPASEQDVIFLPFRQLKRDAAKPAGTGLGLAITKMLVEAHGGQVWLEPARNAGSIFFIKLPTHSAATRPILPKIRR